MNCIPIGPPNFVDFPERSQTSYKNEYGNTLPVEVLWSNEPNKIIVFLYFV